MTYSEYLNLKRHGYKKGEKVFFVYGFAKNEKDNLDRKEIAVFKKAAKELLPLSDEQIEVLIKKPSAQGGRACQS